MTDEFFSPYQFLPLNLTTAKATTERTPYRSIAAGETDNIRHDQYANDSHSGRIVCSVITQSPCAFLSGDDDNCNTDKQAGIKQVYKTKRRGHTKVVAAIPANTLKSAMARSAEYISAAPLRVLDNRHYHRRDTMAESCKALGIIKNLGADGGLVLEPLAMHAVKGNADKTDVCADSRWAKVFNLDTPVNRRFVSYVGNYQSKAGARDVELQKKLQCRQQPLFSFQYQTHPQWCWLKTQIKPRAKNNVLLECPVKDYPLEWKEPNTRSEDHIKGCLYITGGASQHEKMGSGRSKKHELFIPFDESKRVYKERLKITNTHLADFELIANDRSEASARAQDNHAGSQAGLTGSSKPVTLPFMPIGYQNRNITLHYQKDGTSHKSRVADGDIVYFDVDENGDLTRISYSAIWRQRIPGDVWQAFDSIAPDLPTLLPWHAARKSLSAVEALFGVIEQQPDFGRARNLKGRVQVSAAHHRHGAPALSEPVLLRELSSPKAPSRQMYWKNRAGTYVKSEDFQLGSGNYGDDNADKTDTAPQGQGTVARREAHLAHQHRVLPLGVKFYTCFKDTEIAQEPWVHPLHSALVSDPDDVTNLNATRRCSRVPLIEKGQTFDFHVDFTNLDDAELGLLLSSIDPLKDSYDGTRFYHRLGYGKPVGLGHASIQIHAVFYVDRQRRYSANGLTDSRYHHVATNNAEATRELLSTPKLSAAYPIELSSVLATSQVKPLDFTSEHINEHNMTIWRGAGNPDIRVNDPRPVCYPYSVHDNQRPAVRDDVDGLEASGSATDGGEGFKWIVAVEAASRHAYENRLRMPGYINQSVNEHGHPHKLNAKVEGNTYYLLVNGKQVTIQQQAQVQEAFRNQLNAPKLRIEVSKNSTANILIKNCILPIRMPITFIYGDSTYTLRQKK